MASDDFCLCNALLSGSEEQGENLEKEKKVKQGLKPSQPVLSSSLAEMTDCMREKVRNIPGGSCVRVRIVTVSHSPPESYKQKFKTSI
jgi:hypothetical protein